MYLPLNGWCGWRLVTFHSDSDIALSQLPCPAISQQSTSGQVYCSPIGWDIWVFGQSLMSKGLACLHSFFGLWYGKFLDPYSTSSYKIVSWCLGHIRHRIEWHLYMLWVLGYFALSTWYRSHITIIPILKRLSKGSSSNMMMRCTPSWSSWSPPLEVYSFVRCIMLSSNAKSQSMPWARCLVVVVEDLARIQQPFRIQWALDTAHDINCVRSNFLFQRSFLAQPNAVLAL